MVRMVLCGAGAIALLCGQPLAALAITLPDPVQKIVDGYGPQCSQLGGALKNPGAVGVMASDLDGDGEMDYVLNPEALDCEGAATAFCGNGGCNISIALSRNDYGKPIDALGGQPTMTQRSGKTDLEVWVHHTNCPDAEPTTACWATYTWTDGKPNTRYDARPNVE